MVGGWWWRVVGWRGCGWLWVGGWWVGGEVEEEGGMG